LTTCLDLALLEEDAASVAEQAVETLFRLARGLRAQNIDPEVLLAGDSKEPRSPREKLAARAASLQQLPGRSVVMIRPVSYPTDGPMPAQMRRRTRTIRQRWIGAAKPPRSSASLTGVSRPGSSGT
jgi:hypothetical protein